MFAYLLRRLILMVPTLFGITLITFAMLRLAPGDPLAPEAVGAGAVLDQSSRNAKKQLLGMVEECHALWRLSAQPGEPTRDADLESWGSAFAESAAGTWVGEESGRVRRIGEGATFSTPSPVQALAALPNDAVAVGGRDGAVRAYRPDGSLRWTWTSSPQPIQDLLLGPEDLLVATYRRGLIALDPETGREKTAYPTQGGPVRALAPDGAVGFWSAGTGRLLLRWRWGERQPAQTFNVHDGEVLALDARGDQLLTGSDDRTVRLFEPTPNDLGQATLLKGHSSSVRTVALHPTLPTALTGGEDQRLIWWDLAQGAKLGEQGAGGGPARALIGAGAGFQAVTECWQEVPLYRQYLTWVTRTVTLDFGRSFRSQRPVRELLAESLPVTLGLNLASLLLTYLISVPIGVYAAVKRGQTFDRLSSLVLFLLYSIPSFWLATLLIMTFASPRTLDWFPSVGLESPDPYTRSYLAWLADRAAHLVLPLIVMTYASFASVSQFVRTSMLEALSQDFVRTARAKGLPEATVILKHALGNALITIVTLVGTLLPRLIGGSVIVESIFTLDGMGRLGFEAIGARDYPVIMAITTLSALLTMAGMLLSDLLYGVVDPRVREKA